MQQFAQMPFVIVVFGGSDHVRERGLRVRLSRLVGRRGRSIGRVFRLSYATEHVRRHILRPDEAPVLGFQLVFCENYARLDF